MFFWKHWMGKSVTTLPHSLQFLWRTRSYKCQDVHLVAGVSTIYLYIQSKCFNGTVCSSYFLKTFAAEVNQSIHQPFVCWKNDWLLLLIFGSILLLLVYNWETLDHKDFSLISRQVNFNSFWQNCSFLNNISAMQSKGTHALKWKMSQLFHNTATQCPYAMCQKFKSQRECGPGLDISVQQHHSPSE